MIELYINNEKASISDDVEISLNRDFNELTDPTLYCTEYSKTIQLPKDRTNNIIFSHIGELDSEITNATFNPARKFPVHIILDGEAILSGWGKLDEVLNSVESQYYSITVHDEKSSIFQLLKDISVPEDITPFTVNRNTVYRGFTTPHRDFSYSSKNLYDWIGFTPVHRGLYDDFNSKQADIDSSMCNLTENLPFDDATSETILGDGVNEETYREYRSYYQKPFVYANKIIQILLNEFSARYPEYTVELDKRFFNSKNPYWQTLAVMTGNLDLKNEDSNSNGYYGMTFVDASTGLNPTLRLDISSVSNNKDVKFGSISEDVAIISPDSIHFTIDANRDRYRGNFSVSFPLYISVGTDTVTPNIRWTIYDDNSIVTVFRLKDDSGKTLAEQARLFVGAKAKTPIITQYQFSPEDIINIGFLPIDSSEGGNYFIRYDANVSLDIDIPYGTTGNCHWEISSQWARPDRDFVRTQAYVGGVVTRQTTGTHILLSDPSAGLPYGMTLGISRYMRTNRQSSVSDLLGKDFNLYDFFIRYCKMFGLVFDYNYDEKKLRILTRDKYFLDYQIVDWTDRIDRNFSLEISPVSFENRYVMFDSEDIDAAYYTDYRKKYDMNYGSLRLDTHYDFNTDTTELFKEGISPAVMSEEISLDWNDLMNGIITKRKYPEPMPAMYSIDGNAKKDKDIRNCIIFRNHGNREFDSNHRGCFMSDDTPLMSSTDIYCWSSPDSEYAVPITEFPDMDTIDDTRHYASLWTLPEETYYNAGEISDVKSVYDVAWKKFIEDRYSVNSKKITGYFMIKPAEYRNLTFNTFVRIENSLYCINRIIDYNPSSYDTTKVELIEIGEISNYTDGQDYSHYELFLVPPTITLDDTNTGIVTLGGYESISDVSMGFPTWIALNSGRGGSKRLVSDSETYTVSTSHYNSLNPRSGDITATENDETTVTSVIQTGNFLDVSPVFVSLRPNANSNEFVIIRSAKPILIEDVPSWLDVIYNGTVMIDGVEVLEYLIKAVSSNNGTANRTVTLNVTNGINSIEVAVTQGFNRKTNHYDIVLEQGETSSSVILDSSNYMFDNRLTAYSKDNVDFRITGNVLTATRTDATVAVEDSLNIRKALSIFDRRDIGNFSMRSVGIASDRIAAEEIISVGYNIL